MESVEISAKTLEEAIELALREMNASREEVEIEVLSRGKPGFFGLGSEPARVRATRLPVGETNTKTVKEVVDRLLAALGVSATAHIGKSVPDSPDTTFISIEGEDSGLLIGRRGETLRALQFMVNLLVGRRTEGKGRVALDVENYRERRNQALTDLALRVAERVAATGRPVTLEPMPSYERRVIHMALADHPRVTTQSIDDGDMRKVSIIPRRAGSPGRARQGGLPRQERPEPPPRQPSAPSTASEEED